jgi:hypothetical protein
LPFTSKSPPTLLSRGKSKKLSSGLLVIENLTGTEAKFGAERDVNFPLEPNWNHPMLVAFGMITLVIFGQLCKKEEIQ